MAGGANGDNCPGSNRKAVECAADMCTTSEKGACSQGAAISCSPKFCSGKIMANNIIYPAATCRPTYMSLATGIPLPSCKATETALVRNAKGMAKAAGADKSQTGSAAGAKQQAGGRPTLNPNEGKNRLPSAESQDAKLKAALEQQKKVREMQAQQAATMEAAKKDVGTANGAGR